MSVLWGCCRLHPSSKRQQANLSSGLCKSAMTAGQGSILYCDCKLCAQACNGFQDNACVCAGPPADLSRRLHLCRFMQYARSKLCNVLHVLELHRRLSADERRITSYAVSPGRVRTQIFDNLPLIARTLLAPIVWAFFQTPQQVMLPADMHSCTTSLCALCSATADAYIYRSACAHMGVHGTPWHPTM